MTTGSERERFETWFAKGTASVKEGSLEWQIAQKFKEVYWDSWQAAVAPASPPPNTVRVRIPVVTTHDCRHFAYRSHEDTDSEADEYIRGRLCAAGSIVSWITADVPLPSPPVEVKGTVEQ